MLSQSQRKLTSRTISCFSSDCKTTCDELEEREQTLLQEHQYLSKTVGHLIETLKSVNSPSQRLNTQDYNSLHSIREQGIQNFLHELDHGRDLLQDMIKVSLDRVRKKYHDIIMTMMATSGIRDLSNFGRYIFYWLFSS
jgi:hypothetical protein